MKGVILLLWGVFSIGAVGFVGLLLNAGTTPLWLRLVCGAYILLTDILLAVMVISAPKMANLVKKKDKNELH